MNRLRSLVTVIILILLGLGACGGRPQAGGSTGTGDPGGMQWTVRIGSQGGFTGGASGHVVHADGSVESWSRITPQDPIEVQPLGRADTERLRALHRAVVDPKLVALEYRKTGNLTGFLEWRAGDAVRRYSWPERHGGPDLPVELRAAVEAARAAVQSARP